ncbi:MAG: sixA [Pseudonocardiales bacterium]|nr:sixA [Pseudonocardiales bacterium]
MTRKLVLIRHAKSAEGPADIDRPLTPRGRRDAAAVGRLLAENEVVPDRIVVSPALRARQTWEAAQSELLRAVEVVVDDRIYDNQEAALFEVIHDAPDSVQTLALVGHNPSFAAFAESLDDVTGADGERQDLHDGFPTSGVAVFEVPGAWAELRPRTATLKTFDVARGDST